jgi:hypothetical protein
MHLSEIAQLRAAAANLMMASSLRMTCVNGQRERESKSERDKMRVCMHVRTCLRRSPFRRMPFCCPSAVIIVEFIRPCTSEGRKMQTEMEEAR